MGFTISNRESTLNMAISNYHLINKAKVNIV